MIRQVNIFAVAFIACILIADAFAGGLYPVPESQYGELKQQLKNSNMGLVFGNTNIQVLDILSATEEVVENKNYHILATIVIDGRTEKCCFIVHHFFPPQQRFFVISADVGARKC